MNPPPIPDYTVRCHKCRRTVHLDQVDQDARGCEHCMSGRHLPFTSVEPPAFDPRFLSAPYNAVKGYLKPLWLRARVAALPFFPTDREQIRSHTAAPQTIHGKMSRRAFGGSRIAEIGLWWEIYRYPGPAVLAGLLEILDDERLPGVQRLWAVAFSQAHLVRQTQEHYELALAEAVSVKQEVP